MQLVAHHLVEIAHHLAGGGHVLWRHILNLLLHLLGYVLGHLALEHIQQLLELLLRLRVHEVVVHQLLELASHAFRQIVELFQVAVGPLLQEVVESLLLASLVLGSALHLLASLFKPVLNAAPFGVDDVLKAFLEVVQHRVHVVLLHLLAAAVLELLHKLAQTGHLLAVAVLHPLSEQVAEGLHQVAPVEDVVGQQVHQLVGIEVEDVLGSVPLRVAVCAKEHDFPHEGDIGPLRAMIRARCECSNRDSLNQDLPD